MESVLFSNQHKTYFTFLLSKKFSLSCLKKCNSFNQKTMFMLNLPIHGVQIKKKLCAFSIILNKREKPRNAIFVEVAHEACVRNSVQLWP